MQYFLFLASPVFAAIGGVLWIVATVRSGISFGEDNYYVVRSVHRGRFYVSLTTAVLLMIAWFSFILVVAILGLSRGAA